MLRLWNFLGSEPPYDPHGFRSLHRPMGAWIKHLAEPDMGSESSTAKTKQPQNFFSKEYYDRMVKGMVGRKHGYYYNETHYGINVQKDYRQNYRTRNHIETDLVPICYGGVFATYWGLVSSDDAPLTAKGWERIALALGRKDNLEEGHYMERWWADLLSWSSYANQRPSPAATAELVRHDRLSLSLRGVTLPETEQAVLLEDKLRHMAPDNPYAGMVVLDGDKLEREGA